jgi:hypothetical protein
MRGLVRTIIADDHAIIREGLKQLLSTVGELYSQWRGGGR